MAWVFLVFAGLLEVFWSSFLKLSEGFTKLGWPVGDQWRGCWPASICSPRP